MQSVDAAKNISLASVSLLNSFIPNSHANHKSLTKNWEDDDIHEVINEILVATEASLLVCNLYATSEESKLAPNDHMRKIVKFVQLQMRETIFPAFDPLFELKSAEQSDKKTKLKSKNEIEKVYFKLVQIIDVCMTLFARYSFNDSIVFEMSAVSVESLFVDNIGAMQLACLGLVTTVRHHHETEGKIVIHFIFRFFAKIRIPGTEFSPIS